MKGVIEAARAQIRSTCLAWKENRANEREGWAGCRRTTPFEVSMLIRTFRESTGVVWLVWLLTLCQVA